MACRIELINPTNLNTEKVLTLDKIYSECEKHVSELNKKLNSKSNSKGLYWKVMIINC